MTTQSARELAGKPTPDAQIGRVVFIAYLGLAAIAWIGIAVLCAGLLVVGRTAEVA